MVLSDKTILKEIEKGKIIVSPFDKKYLNPNSVDLTLAPLCKIYKNTPKNETDVKIRRLIGEDIFNISVLDPRKQNEVYEFTIPEEGYILQPGELYLYSCNERIGCKGDICATVMGKSSLGRLGLDIHVCAGFIDSGFEGSLVLEMRVVRPLIIYPNMKICQIKFERVEGEVEEDYSQKEGSKYFNQSGVQESLYHKNFDNETSKD